MNHILAKTNEFETQPSRTPSKIVILKPKLRPSQLNCYLVSSNFDTSRAAHKVFFAKRMSSWAPMAASI